MTVTLSMGSAPSRENVGKPVSLSSIDTFITVAKIVNAVPVTLYSRVTM